MSLLDLKKKVRSSLNIMFGYNMIPVIKKTPHVTKNTVTAIDYFHQLCYLKPNLK